MSSLNDKSVLEKLNPKEVALYFRELYGKLLRCELSCDDFRNLLQRLEIANPRKNWTDKDYASYRESHYNSINLRFLEQEIKICELRAGFVGKLRKLNQYIGGLLCFQGKGSPFESTGWYRDMIEIDKKLQKEEVFFYQLLAVYEEAVLKILQSEKEQ